MLSGIDTKTGQPVAIKVIELDRLSKKDIASIQSEVAILTGVDHPNIVKLVSSCFDAHHAYVITELVEGGELFDSIITREYYSEADAQIVLRDLASALQYCHSRKIVHRDLKPENILLSSKGDDAIIKVIDFGFAKRSEGDDAMLTTALGTPNYIAPEILNRQPYNEAVDMWSFGVIAYVLLCGYPPFHDENHSELYKKIKKGFFVFDSPYWDNVSQSAKNLISGLIVLDPEKRMTVQDVLQHEWIVNTLPKKDITPAISELRSNLARRRLKTGVRGILALNKMKGLLVKKSDELI